MLKEINNWACIKHCQVSFLHRGYVQLPPPSPSLPRPLGKELHFRACWGSLPSDFSLPFASWAPWKCFPCYRCRALGGHQSGKPPPPHVLQARLGELLGMGAVSQLRQSDSGGSEHTYPRCPAPPSRAIGVEIDFTHAVPRC